MADAEVFDFVCELLEGLTVFDRLEARGTVRIALKQAGVEPRFVTAEQMSVVVTKLLASELESRGITDGAGFCETIDRELSRLQPSQQRETPEAVFERLGT